MTISVLQLDLSIPDAMSLKDKRRVVRSLKDRLRNGRNVSVAEVASQDNHRRAVIAVAMVGSDAEYVDSALRKLVDFTQTVTTADLTDWQIDVL